MIFSWRLNVCHNSQTHLYSMVILPESAIQYIRLLLLLLLLLLLMLLLLVSFEFDCFFSSVWCMYVLRIQVICVCFVCCCCFVVRFYAVWSMFVLNVYVCVPMPLLLLPLLPLLLRFIVALLFFFISFLFRICFFLFLSFYLFILSVSRIRSAIRCVCMCVYVM